MREEFDEHWRETIRRIVRDGQSAGEFSEVNVEDFAVALSALLDGFAIQIALEDPVVNERRAFDLAMRLAAEQLGFAWDPRHGPTASDGTAERPSCLDDVGASGPLGTTGRADECRRARYGYCGGEVVAGDRVGAFQLFRLLPTGRRLREDIGPPGVLGLTPPAPTTAVEPERPTE